MIAKKDKRGDAAAEPVVLGQATRTCSVPLTNDELLTKADRLAQIEDEIRQEELHQEDQKRAMKSRLAALDSERASVASTVRRKAEPREVVCDLIVDLEHGKVHETRTDTGERIFTRLMTDEEKQRKLVPDGKPAGDGVGAAQ